MTHNDGRHATKFLVLIINDLRRHTVEMYASAAMTVS